MTTQYNRVLDSGGSLKLPGEHNDEFAQVVSNYLKGFHCCLHLDKKTLDRTELYAWCAAHLGPQFKDWFIYEGGQRDKVWVIHIRSPKHSTFFRLKYNSIILNSVDL